MGEALRAMVGRLLRGGAGGHGARSVELFGWLILAEGAIIVLAPAIAASLLHLPELSPQASNYFRLVGLLVSGLGILYVGSGRLGTPDFVFVSLLDRPAVPVVMAIFWSLGWIPGILAIAFSIQDGGGALWTLLAWRRDLREGRGPGATPGR